MCIRDSAGSAAEVLNLVAPRLSDALFHRLARRFPDSPAAKKAEKKAPAKKSAAKKAPAKKTSKKAAEKKAAKKAS